MKFFIVFALFVAAASARFIVPDAVAAEAAEIQEILAAINNPSTDPATAAALQQLLNEILGIQESPIDVGPVIVDEIEQSPTDVGPVIIDEADFIDVSPVIVDQPTPTSSPLVQIIINVKSGASIADGPVEIEPTPVIVVDNEDIENIEKPIIDIPAFPSPALVPDILN